MTSLWRLTMLLLRHVFGQYVPHQHTLSPSELTSSRNVILAYFFVIICIRRCKMTTSVATIDDIFIWLMKFLFEYYLVHWFCGFVIRIDSENNVMGPRGRCVCVCVVCVCMWYGVVCVCVFCLGSTLLYPPWWRHQIETFSALLAICAGIHRSPVNSPHKGQWRGALMFSLICALNKRLSKQSWGW